MLNELYSLSSVLNNMGISAGKEYREYTPLSKAQCYRIWISNDGKIYGIEELKSELVQELRKFGNKQASFPAFNIAALYRLIDKQQISDLEQMKNNYSLLAFDKVKLWCANDNWNDSLTLKVNNCLHKVSDILLKKIEKQGLWEEKAIVKLVESANSFSDTLDNSKGSFRIALENYVLERLRRGEDVKTALTFLFHRGNPKKAPKEDRGTLSVVLDLFEWQQYGYPIASEYTTRWINDMLLKSDLSDDKTVSGDGEFDAFGMPFNHVGEPMPTIRLKGFDVVLRSMFRGQPCQYRYQKIDDTSYPISKANRYLIRGAFGWIAQTDKEGITWKQVDKNEIVFVYPSQIPAVPLNFVSLFSVQQGDKEKKTEARFANVAQDFIKALKGLPPKEKPDYIQVFSIRKMDKARSKIVFTRNYSTDGFVGSAKEWETGCNNIPDLEFEKEIPFPLQVARIINNVWKQDGRLANTGKTLVRRVQYYQGIELFLDPVQESMSRYYLGILLLNSSGLIKHSGIQTYIKKDISFKEKNLNNEKKEIALVLSVLGLLLYKCGYKKEDYMDNIAYLVGQILKISDELHEFYCKIVRNGDVPRQLVGNSMFVMASETPNQALAQLGIRMSPYIAWAKQYRKKNIQDKDKESWRAGWYLDLYEDVANKLYSLLSDITRFDDFGKAQFFVGYLAAFPKREKKIMNDIDVEKNTNDVEGDCNE